MLVSENVNVPAEVELPLNWLAKYTKGLSFCSNGTVVFSDHH